MGFITICAGGVYQESGTSHLSSCLLLLQRVLLILSPASFAWKNWDLYYVHHNLDLFLDGFLQVETDRY